MEIIRPPIPGAEAESVGERRRVQHQDPAVWQVTPAQRVVVAAFRLTLPLHRATSKSAPTNLDRHASMALGEASS